MCEVYAKAVFGGLQLVKAKMYSFLRHPLISGSALIFLGSNIGNVFNFLYNLFMLRSLPSADYGTLLGLISIITLFAQMADSLTPFVVNFAAQYFAQGEIGKAKALFYRVASISVIIGLLLLAVFLFFSSQIGQFLNIRNNQLIMITGVCVFFVYLGIVNKAFLQAKLVFTFLAGIIVFGAIIKLFSGVYLVWIGLGVQGAVFAFLLSFLLPYLLTFFPLRFLLRRSQKKSKVHFRTMIKFGVGSFFSIVGITAFVTTDILLVKHFFSPHDAGLYAGMTIAGKIIFFFSAPIASVMFPLIVRKFAKKEDYHGDFRLALSLVLLPSIALTVVYFLFPTVIIQLVMKRDEYFAIAPYLGYIGIFFTLYSLEYIMINFFLSIQKTHIFLPVVGFALLQAVGIWLFHKTVFEVLLVSICTSGLLLISLLLYYAKISYFRKHVTAATLQR